MTSSAGSYIICDQLVGLKKTKSLSSGPGMLGLKKYKHVSKAGYEEPEPETVHSSWKGEK